MSTMPPPANSLPNQCSETPFIGKVRPPSRPLERQHEDRDHRAVEEQHDTARRTRPAARTPGGASRRASLTAPCGCRPAAISAAMIISIDASRTTALAAAAGNCSAFSRVSMILPAEAICWPPITPTVTKSPITMVTTKIEPMTMPGLRQRHDRRSTASASRWRRRRSAASIRRAVDAHHRVEDRHHHEEREEVDERQHHGEFGEQQPLQRLVDQPQPISAWLTRPLRPSSGIQEIMRITFEVQNGMVQTQEQHRSASVVERTWKARK